MTETGILLFCSVLEWWGAGVVVCLERGAHLHMALLMPLPLTVFFWYQCTRCSPGKGLLNVYILLSALKKLAAVPSTLLVW